MSRHRSSRNAIHRACRKVARAMGLDTAALAPGAKPFASSEGYLFELLEPRRLMTTLSDTTGTPQTFDYVGGTNIAEFQITYSDVTFEAVGALVDQTTGAVQVGDLLQTSVPNIDCFLYKIYVTSAQPDSFITVTELNNLGLPIPYSGAIDPYTGRSDQGQPYSVQLPDGTGEAIVGAVEPTPGPLVLSVPLTQSIGIMPAPESGNLAPGIEVIANDPATDEQNDIGSLLIGGPVTGSVSFGGNVGKFYAGAVITGNSNGGGLATGATSAVAQTPNFTVAGDIRDFETNGPVGTDDATAASAPLWVTDFYMTVGGQLGSMHLGNDAMGTVGDLFGQVQVHNDKSISTETSVTASTANPLPTVGDYSPQLEFEALPPINQAQTEFTTNGQPLPTEPTFNNPGTDLRNDALADAQVLDSVPVDDEVTGLPTKDSSGNVVYHADLYGILQETEIGADTIDTYAAGLQAGQTFQADLNAAEPLLLSIFDPDGRIVSSNVEAGNGVPFSYTPDRPGIYHFQVQDTTGYNTDVTYELTVSNIGNEAISGITSNGSYSDLGFDGGITADYGSIGSIEFDGLYDSSTSGPTPSSNPSVPLSAPASISVPDGNLNAFVAGSMGTETNQVLSGGAYLNVPFGSVGLIQSTTGVLDVHSQFDVNYLGLSTPQYVTNTAYATAIQGDIQVIDAATAFEGELATDKGIGTIRAGNLATLQPSHIQVNADNSGYDGIIDLIDVSGDLGTLNGGGPDILTGDGGQVRYMNVTGNVFRPNLFGGGIDSPILYDVGQTATFTTDAGDTISATPVGQTTTVVTTPSPTATNSTTTVTTTGPQLTILTYPVVDKAGQIPISINSSGGLTITASGTAGKNSQVTIGTVVIQGVGRTISAGINPDNNQPILDQYGNQLLEQAAAPTSITTTTTVDNADGSVTATTVAGDPTDLNLIIGGSASVSAMDVTSTGSAIEIADNTPGDLVSINTPAVGQIITHGNLGFAKPFATAAAVYPRSVITNGNVYPFVQQHTGIVVTSNAIDIDAYGAIGNVQVLGTVDNIIANFAVSTLGKGAYPIPGQIDGIVGPIVGGRLLNIDIGQELTPSGDGAVGLSGIFATGKIGQITNFGNPNGDIRGNIISSDTDSTNVGIDAIKLSNASIIDSVIGVLSNSNYSDTAKYFDATFSLPNGAADPFQTPYPYTIGQITVSGKGGIIGSNINCSALGQVSVINGGFGILDSDFSGSADARFEGFTVSGYGLRNTNISGGAYVGQVTLTGNGSLVSVLTYPSDVRQSDNSDILTTLDPFTGLTPSATTDLNIALGTSAEFPNIANVTDTGVASDDLIQGQQTFAGLTAYKIRTTEPVFNASNVLPTPSVPNIPFIGVEFPMSIDFGQAVGTIRSYSIVDGLQITAGRLVAFAPGGNVSRLGISVAGNTGTLNFHGNVGQLITDPRTGDIIPDSYISAGGPSGTINNLIVHGSLFANVSAVGEIKNALILGDVQGTITAQAQSVPLGLGTLHVSGNIRNGSLAINGSIGSIIVNGGLGATGGSLTVQGNANLIAVGIDHGRKTSDLALALDVTGTLNTLSVYGQISGSVTTGGDLNNLSVTGISTASTVISGSINVGGRMTVATVHNGNIAGSLIANGAIGAFNLIRGNVLSGATIESQIDAIRNFRINGGGMYGSLLTESGLNENIYISGNLGDGADAATIVADSGSVFRINGSIQTNSSIDVTFGLKQLQVNGSIAAGATVTAHPLTKLIVKGTNLGTITAG